MEVVEVGCERVYENLVFVNSYENWGSGNWVYEYQTT